MAGSGAAHLRDGEDTLLRVEHLVVEFPAGGKSKVHAVSDVSFDVKEGETLGLVGESGCGKSTSGRAIIQLPRPTSGSVRFDGQELTGLKGEALRAIRPRMQLIFQDPISSLNPRRRVADIVAEPLAIWNRGNKTERQAKVTEVFDAVGLDAEAVGQRRPHEFSGGQCQRISIARALVLDPRLIICDEPVSALDVSVQAQILNLLEDAKARYRLTLVFIAHDLAVVKNVSDRVAVMYLGKLCEVAPSDELYRAPAHPYTAALLSAIPEPDPDASTRDHAGISGELPSTVDPPSGCRYRTRCPKAQQRCALEEPMMRSISPGHFVACHFPMAGQGASVSNEEAGYSLGGEPPSSNGADEAESSSPAGVASP
jgi:peptide/nickel transport system ATP-binding protein